MEDTPRAGGGRGRRKGGSQVTNRKQSRGREGKEGRSVRVTLKLRHIKVTL